MATNFTSNQYANQTQVARSGSPSRLCGMFFEGATATADTGTINLCHLPPGKIRILARLCGFQCDDMAANANISLRIRQHEDGHRQLGEEHGRPGQRRIGNRQPGRCRCHLYCDR